MVLIHPLAQPLLESLFTSVSIAASEEFFSQVLTRKTKLTSYNNTWHRLCLPSLRRPLIRPVHLQQTTNKRQDPTYVKLKPLSITLLINAGMDWYVPATSS